MKKEKAIQALEIPKLIKGIAYLLERISPSLSIWFAGVIFGTPIKFKRPKREEPFAQNSVKSRIYVPHLKTHIQLYQLPSSGPKVLLIHGWSGRGTQMHAIADICAKAGMDITSYDAPAHGESSGKRTNVPEFVITLQHINKTMGPFDYAIGHSMGGVTLLNAIRFGVQFKGAVLIGTNDHIRPIFVNFIRLMGLPNHAVDRLLNHFHKKVNASVETFDGSNGAAKANFPVLVIHCKDDLDVPISSAYSLHKALDHGELLVTKGLGHRRILRDKEILESILHFLNTLT